MTHSDDEATHRVEGGSRRRFLKRSIARTSVVAAGVSAGVGVTAGVQADVELEASALSVPNSWKTPGAGFSNYGSPVAERRDVIRWITNNPAAPGEGVSWSPLHSLEGTVTPNGLHFERHHNGVAELEADHYALQIDGQLRTPLTLNLKALHGYPMQSRMAFIECGGNSNALWQPSPVQALAGHLHGLVSCAEWTGVRLADVLEPLGLHAEARWVIAEGYDSAGVTVSLPLDKALDDTVLALYQNGEPLRAENGYPVRLLVPGWEGIVNVKWLKRLYLSDKPAMSRFDTVSYTDRHPDGTATRFSFEMGVKSVITRPSPQAQALQPGAHEISGVAWTGAGIIAAVDISTDGGRQWQPATLQQPILDRAFTRFRMPWRWDGNPVSLQSRARDSTGAVQPERAALLADKGPSAYYHYNAILAWSIDRDGAVRHVYV